MLQQLTLHFLPCCENKKGREIAPQTTLRSCFSPEQAGRASGFCLHSLGTELFCFKVQAGSSQLELWEVFCLFFCSFQPHLIRYPVKQMCKKTEFCNILENSWYQWEFLQACRKNTLQKAPTNPLKPLRGFDSDSIVIEIKLKPPANKNTSNPFNTNMCSWTFAAREWEKKQSSRDAVEENMFSVSTMEQEPPLWASTAAMWLHAGRKRFLLQPESCLKDPLESIKIFISQIL